ncbi:signal peptidase I [Amycolatopsis minnesotensis]|uniref:Signal peptidase I n=1 Tax=Amycolatopsis minnesotensis TaxID=337894 RepID=A0ABN2RNG7_9PSEU
MSRHRLSRHRQRVSIALFLLGVALCCAGIVPLVIGYRVVNVNGDSMAPVLRHEDTAVADTGIGNLRRGDVVLLDPAALGGHGEPVALRVIGLGGDTVTCCVTDGRLAVNGQPIAEEYLDGDAPASMPFSVAVTPGRLFVLGDHRTVATDSRARVAGPGAGAVPASAVRGRVVARAWPLTRAGELDATRAFSRFAPPRDGAIGLIVAVSVVLAGVVFLAASGFEALRRRPK